MYMFNCNKTAEEDLGRWEVEDWVKESFVESYTKMVCLGIEG